MVTDSQGQPDGLLASGQSSVHQLTSQFREPLPKGGHDMFVGEELIHGGTHVRTLEDDLTPFSFWWWLRHVHVTRTVKQNGATFPHLGGGDQNG
ncbi:hypothetical protein [Nocardiopsis sp. M1B1]|uniref:hypothetical protein n=1 Tax=Nocardiopsis sp. M1B1 TaxID=3450454 RepID=UPI004039EB14